jgi:parallel beta-helix repeat protein
LIDDNSVVLGGDDGDATDWIQNIAFYFWNGMNQTLSNNTVTFQGDGTRTVGYSGPKNGASFGYQSGTTGGTAYDGLLITNNVFQVGNASNGIEEVYGIWENGHNDTAGTNIDLTNNQFLGRSGDDFDHAFLLSSQTDGLVISGNTFNGVDEVFTATKSQGHSTGDKYTFAGNTLVNVGGADGIFLNNVTNDTTPIHVVIYWNTSNTIDGETGVRGLNELSVQATHAVRASSAAEDLDAVIALPLPPYNHTYASTTWGSLPRFSDPDGIGTGYGPVAMGYNTFTKIQDAINAVTAGGIVDVAGGVYKENVLINKPLQLIGAGAGVVTVYPALSAPNPCAGSSLCGGLASNIILVQADDVTISGMTLDGDNPDITSGLVRNGADLDARNGIIENHAAGSWDRLTVHDVVVKNIYLRGIYSSSSGTGFHLYDNTIENVDGESQSIAIMCWVASGIIEGNTITQSNDAIASQYSRGIQVLNNTITDSGSGVHTDNQGSSVTDVIQGNQVSDCRADGYGIWAFVPNGVVNLDGNTITNCSVSLSVWGTRSTATVNVTNNEVDGNNLTNGIGILETTNLAGWGSDHVSATFTNNKIANAETAVYLWVEDTYNLSIHANGNSFTGYTNGVVIEGTGTIPVPDLSANWWGSNDAAVVKAAANGGVTIDYTPWLDGGLDGAGIGFQGDFSALWVDDDSPQSGALGRIHEGVDDVTPDGTVHVLAGIYAESDVPLDKDLDLLGPNAGINANTGIRVDEAVWIPAINDTSEVHTLAHVLVSSVTIDGFTFDGDNPGIFGGEPLGGADVNANAAVDNYNDTSGLFEQIGYMKVENNIIQNFLWSSVYLDVDYNSTNSSGNYIRYNHFDNMWESVQTYAAHADISGNVFDNVTRGISMHQVIVAADAGFVPQITNNTVNVVYNWASTSRNTGIWVNGRQAPAPDLLVSGNVVNTPNSMAGYEYRAYSIYNITDDAVLEFTNNTLNGAGNTHIGLYVWGTSSANPVVVSGGAFNDVKDAGIFINNDDPTWGPADTALTVGDVAISMEAGGTGVRVFKDPAHTQYADLTLDGFTGSGMTTAVDVDGGTADITNSELSGNNTGALVRNNGTATLHYNLISGNTSFGVNNTTGTVVDE